MKLDKFRQVIRMEIRFHTASQEGQISRFFGQCDYRSITFTQAPDFENPTDVGSNNEYNLRVAASDGSSSTEQDVVVTVTNIEESTPNSPPTALDSGGTLVMRRMNLWAQLWEFFRHRIR